MRKILSVLLLVALGTTVSAQRITESLQYWTLGVNSPEIQSTTRGDGTTGNCHYLPLGTSPYYYGVMTEGEGLVEFWLYDPCKCLSSANPGYGVRGEGWGLQNPSYQVAAVTDDRSAWVDGCRGWSPWSTMSPYSPWWFVSGVRGNGDVPWTAGWYRWTIDGKMDDVTFTLCDVNYLSNDEMVFGSPSLTINAASFDGGWAALFGFGWQGFWLKGDAADGIEDIKIDVTGGTGAFAEFGTAGVARPYQKASWGNIKALYR